MKLEQLCQLDYGASRKPLEVEGTLMVSTIMACIADMPYEDTATTVTPGILIREDWLPKDKLLDDLQGLAADVYVGGPLLYTVKVKMYCQLRPTGIPGLPWYLNRLYHLTVFAGDESWTFHYGEPEVYHHIYLLPATSISVSALKAVKHLFPATLTFMQLKQHLKRGEESLIARYCTAKELESFISVVEQAGLSYRLEQVDLPYFLGG